MSFPRYPEYKDSGVEWLGEVPAHWDVVQFKQFVDIQNGADHKHIEQDEGYRVFGSGGIFTYASKFLYDGESVLLGRKGTIDKPLHVTGRFWTVDTMYWTKINPHASGKFTYYVALTIPFSYYSTNTALPSMTKGALSSHVVTRPSLIEQTKIATFLDGETAKIDALVAEQRRLMALLKEKRQAVILHAVTQGLDPDAPMKPSGVEWLGDVPAHWQNRRVKSVSTFTTSGPRGWSDHVGDEGSLFIQSGDLNNSLGIDFFGAKKVQVGNDAEAARTRLSDGDVVVCITGAKTGNVAVCITVPDVAYINQHLCLIRPSPEILPMFLGNLLKSSFGQTYFNFSQYGLKQGLSLEDVRNGPTFLPPLAEQITIIDYVNAESTKFDALITEAQCGIDLLQERRTALISAAVTGQIDVREAFA